jgi:hypothetical protein
MGNGLDIKSLIRATKNTDTIITGPLTEFLITKGDEALSREVGELMFKLLTTPPRYRGDSFSASSAGKCERAQVFQFLAMGDEVVDAQLQNIFNDGKWRHLRWQATLLMAGILTDVEDPLFWKRKKSRGTMDGSGIVPMDHPRARWRGQEFGFELKGDSTFLFQSHKANGPKEDHLNQVARYFLMSGFKLFVILYEDKSTQEWHEWVFDADEPEMRQRIEDQRAELDRLNHAVDREKLPPMLPECVKRGQAFRSCGFGGVGGVCLAHQNKDWPDINKKRNAI